MSFRVSESTSTRWPSDYRKGKRDSPNWIGLNRSLSQPFHELRTPLTTIKALTRLLMRNDLDENKRREYIETISVECDRQIDFVLNLLDLSRIEGGVMRVTHERVDVEEVISSVVKSEARSADKRNHELRVEPKPDVPPVCADRKSFDACFQTSSRTPLSTHQTVVALCCPRVKKTRR